VPRTEIGKHHYLPMQLVTLKPMHSSPLGKTVGYSNGGGWVFGLSGCRVRACKREDHLQQVAVFSAA